MTSERALSILFTDVEGSTALRADRGDDIADELLATHARSVRDQIVRHAGQEIQFLGDGFFVAFADATDAIRCAVGIQRALGDHARADPDRAVRVRIGVHHGPVGERDGIPSGQVVHAAARIVSEAAGGQILVSAAVAALAEGSTECAFLDRGEFWLKGFPRRWRLFEVPWEPEAPAPDRPALGALTPFVGREEERALLRRALDRARDGRGCLALVAGEPGVGKTRLLEELEAEATARAVRVFTGHCVELEGAPPYLPFVELLEQALVSPRSPLALRAAVGDLAPEIARIIPALRRVMPDIPAPLELPPDQARRYLWNSVVEFIERACRDLPLLLHLEDLHWGDESTFALLEHLAGHLAGMPVLVVGTYRDTDVGALHPLARTINQLQRRHLVTRIALHRLTEAGVGEMVSGLARQEPPGALVRAVYAETDGNPFFVEEVYLHLEESGALLDATGRFKSDLRIAELDVPESIRLVVGGRLGRLSPGTRAALTAAAIVGRSFAAPVAADVAGQAPDAFADALDEAERARLIAPAREDEAQLTFTHELIRQTLLADVSTVRRQRLHARAAATIEARYADDLDSHAADLTHHLSRAGAQTDPARLVHYLRLAGERALETAAFGDAVEHFEKGLALTPGDDAATRAAFLERLALARRSVGGWDEALDAMDEALTSYQHLGRTDDIGRLCWTTTYHLTWAARYEEAFRVAGRGLEALGERRSADRARLMSALGWVFGLSGDFEAAEGMFVPARALAEELGDKRALADVLHMETIHDLGYARLERGVEAGLAAADVFDVEGALWDLCSVLAFVLYQAGTMGHREQAHRLVERVEPLAARLGHLGATFMTLSERIRAEGVMDGDLDTVEALAPQQIEVCERGGLPWLYVGYLYLGLAAHWRGDWAAAERHLRTAADLEAPGAFSGQGLAHLAVHLAYAGRVDEVLSIVESRRDTMPVPGRVASLGAWNALLGFTEALYVAGQHESAASFYPLIEEALAVGDWITFDCRLLQTRAGIAAAAGGLWDEAEGHYRAAAEGAARMSNRIEQADVLRLHARMLLERGSSADRGRARAMLADAAERYHDIGMPEHEALARALLAGLS